MEKQVLLYDETGKLPEVFTNEEIKTMVKTIKSSKMYINNDWGEWMKARDTAILMTLYLMALRCKEACSLRFNDFNKDGTVKIRGENNKTKKDRVIPVPIQLLPYYKKYFSFNYIKYWHGSPYLFPSMESPALSSQTWKTIYREKVLKVMGKYEPPKNTTIPKYRSYTLRHTRATELLNLTKDIFLVSNILGHAKLNSTKIYLHRNKEYLDYMRVCMNNLKGGTI